MLKTCLLRFDHALQSDHGCICFRSTFQITIFANGCAKWNIFAKSISDIVLQGLYFSCLNNDPAMVIPANVYAAMAFICP